MEINKDKFARRFKQLRENMGIGQKELAVMIGVKRSTVGSWETAHRLPELEKAHKVADIFNVPLDYLLGRTDDPTPPQSPKKEPEHDLYVKDAQTLPNALQRVAEVVAKYQLDLNESKRLSDLVFDKFGKPQAIDTDEAAQTRKNVPGTGVLRQKRNDGSNDKH